MFISASGSGAICPQFFPVEELLQPQRGAEAEDRVVAAQIGGDQAFDLLLRPQGRVDAPPHGADAQLRERTVQLLPEEVEAYADIAVDDNLLLPGQPPCQRRVVAKILSGPRSCVG